MGAWLKGELAPLLRELLSAESVEAAGCSGRPTVAALIAAHARQPHRPHRSPAGAAQSGDLGRMYLDGRAPADVADELKAVPP